VQQKNDGTHAILPVAAHSGCETDHAGVPVMWLRHSHGKMRRDGFPAVLMQPVCPVDERGRVPGAPGLCRGPSCIRGPCRNRGDERQWVRTRKKLDRLRRLFKSGFEKPVHAASRRVAESGAWCNDLDGRWHKGELR
jgi:hypothetical protein